MEPLLPPTIPGVAFRPFAGADDPPAVAALMDACWRADGVDTLVSEEAVARMFAPRPGYDPVRQTLVALDGQRVIGVARHLRERLRDGSDIYPHHYVVHPDWRGRGVEQALLRWNEDRARAMAAAQDSSSAPRETSEAKAPDRLAWLDAVRSSETALIALLTAHAYAPVHQDLIMLRPALDDTPAAALPPGFQERPIAPEQFPALYAAYKEFFADAFDATPPSEADYQRWVRRRCFHDLSLGHVAWAGDRVAGMALCAISADENARYGRLRGYVEHVGVVPAYRGHGLARALLLGALATLRERGMREASLIVDAQNRYGAVQLYESAGFVPISVLSTYAKPLYR